MKRDIGDLLVENGQITEEELKFALDQREKISEPTGSLLLRLGLISEDNLKTVLELQYGTNYLDLKKITPDTRIITLLPQKVVLQYDVVPVQISGQRLTLAMVTPTDTEALASVKEYLKDWQLNIVVCSDDSFQSFVGKAYPTQKPALPIDSQKSFIQLDESYGSDNVLLEEQLGQGVDENRAMILLSHHILSNAINKGCSNIHIEPNDRQVLVHYRKEGVLFPARKLPKSILPELVQRFKIMAARAAEGISLPYDGVLNVRHSQRDFSFRLSIIPGAFGEHLVIWLE